MKNPLLCATLCITATAFLLAGCEKENSNTTPYKAIPLEEFLPGTWTIDPTCYYRVKEWYEDSTQMAIPDTSTLYCTQFEVPYPGQDSLIFSETGEAYLPVQELNMYVDFTYEISSGDRINLTSADSYYLPSRHSLITLSKTYQIIQLDEKTLLIPGNYATRIPYYSLLTEISEWRIFKYIKIN